MGDAAEVAAAVDACGAAPGTVLFHCVSAYPAPLEQCNLRAIPEMVRAHGVPVGWSDHTTGVTSALGAVALGASVLEKHVTTDRTRPGPDHAASLEPDELDPVRRRVPGPGRGPRRRAQAPGPRRGGERPPRPAQLARRARPGRGGDASATADVVLLRPEGGVAPSEVVVGRTVRAAVAAGAPLPPDALGDGS